MHESVYLASRGHTYLTSCIAPVFGLYVRGIPRLVLHCVHVGLLVLLLLWPFEPIVAYGVFCTTTLQIFSFPSRLPNHVALAWFLLLGLAVDHLLSAGGLIYLLNAQFNVCIVYLFSGFHKLNLRYISKKTSCGVLLVSQYIAQKRISAEINMDTVYYIAVPVIIVIEIFSPFLLCTGVIFGGVWLYLILLFLILLHAAFGFLAHVHFSILMISALTTFADADFSTLVRQPTAINWIAVMVITIAGILLGLAFGNHRPYRLKALSTANHALFGVVISGAACSCVALMFLDNPTQGGQFAIAVGGVTILVATGCLAMLPVVSAMAPYLGLKYDFSYSMFSNLRPDFWTHIVVKRNRPLRKIDYFSVRYIGTDYDQWLAFSRIFPEADRSVFHQNYLRDGIEELGCSKEMILVAGSDGEYRSTSAMRLETFGWGRLTVEPYALPVDGGAPYCN